MWPNYGGVFPRLRHSRDGVSQDWGGEAQFMWPTYGGVVPRRRHSSQGEGDEAHCMWPTYRGGGGSEAAALTRGPGAGLGGR